MSYHEHHMVPDRAIPPYAWHYKCDVPGCDYETDSFRIPDDKDAEIARLRAENKTLRAEFAPFVAVARAAIRVTQNHRPECFESADPCADLADALAHPAVQAKVKKASVNPFSDDYPKGTMGGG